MNFEKLHSIYFIGIGGIGMSALARYFKMMNFEVAGYDKVSTELTTDLESEGIDINYEDTVDLIPNIFKDSQDDTLIVFTPAIPDDHKQWAYFRNNGYLIYKRSQVLGMITQNKKGIAVAGTHGKTTITTLTSHLFKQSLIDCSAFLGGISKNYQTNFLYSMESDFVVVEADEYDRSFLTLYPEVAIISSMDADHLDIYDGSEDLKNTFSMFAGQINANGILIKKLGLDVKTSQDTRTYTYSLDDPQADFYAKNIRIKNGFYHFDIVTPDQEISEVMLGYPGLFNVENSIAAVAAAVSSGVKSDEIRIAMETFEGAQRRFDFHIRNNDMVYIDDYAHHPVELNACIKAVKEIYPEKKITGIFQPHLYSRTNDFYMEFAQALNLLDELILLDIYPAREKPIAGVSSQLIFDEVIIENKKQIKKEELIKYLMNQSPEVLLTMGAGNIDEFVKPITKLFTEK